MKKKTQEDAFDTTSSRDMALQIWGANSTGFVKSPEIQGAPLKLEERKWVNGKGGMGRRRSEVLSPVSV